MFSHNATLFTNLCFHCAVEFDFKYFGYINNRSNFKMYHYKPKLLKQLKQTCR